MVALECGVRGVLPLLRFVFCDLIVESIFFFRGRLEFAECRNQFRCSPYKRTPQ